MPANDCCAMILVPTSLDAIGRLSLMVSRFDEFRQSKVENLRVVVTRDHDVVGLQITMHDAGGVRFGQTFSHLVANTSAAFAGQCARVWIFVAQRDAID